MFLMGRDEDHNIRRGVIHENVLIEHGLKCSLSSNNSSILRNCSLIRRIGACSSVSAEPTAAAVAFLRR